MARYIFRLLSAQFQRFSARHSSLPIQPSHPSQRPKSTILICCEFLAIIEVFQRLFVFELRVRMQQTNSRKTTRQCSLRTITSHTVTLELDACLSNKTEIKRVPVTTVYFSTDPLHIEHSLHDY